MRSIIWWFTRGRPPQIPLPKRLQIHLYLPATFIVVWYLTSIRCVCVCWVCMKIISLEMKKSQEQQAALCLRMEGIPSPESKKKRQHSEGISPVPAAWLSVPKQPQKIYTKTQKHQRDSFTEMNSRPLKSSLVIPKIHSSVFTHFRSLSLCVFGRESLAKRKCFQQVLFRPKG